MKALCSIAAGSVLAVAGVFLGPSHATAASGPVQTGAPSVAPGHVGATPYSPQHLLPQGSISGLAPGSAHYLYADEGISPGHDGAADNIEVFRLENGNATNVQVYATTANQQADFYGANSLAYVPPNKTHGACLIQADGSGKVDSYTIDPSAHTISAQASSVMSAFYNDPADVKIAPGGAMAIVTVAPSGTYLSGLEAYTIGSGCVLSAAGSYSSSSVYFVSSALMGDRILVTADYLNNQIDTFGISPSGAFTLEGVTASALLYPDGVASDGRDVFTGNAYDYYPHALTQGGLVRNGQVSYFHSSPAKDGRGQNSAAVWYDGQFGNLVLGEQSTASLGIFGAGGHMTLRQHVTLAFNKAQPTDFAQLGTTLLVDGNVSGDIEACQLDAKGSSGCATVAVLSNPTGYSDGIAVD
ncbi:MAG TPA: hypothetical protein VKX16_17890 [Chloroflexota bacterium]|nr:hypothetical protein [Chloroflexota bacterium]